MDNNTIVSSDTNLSEEYRTLQRVCVSSFLDECVNLKEYFVKISARYEETQDILKHHSARVIFVKKQEAEVLERSAALLASPDWEKNQEEIEAIQKAASIVGEYKRDCESGKIRAEIAQKAYVFIVDCVAFSARIQRRRKFWKQFGLDQASGIDISEEVLTDAHRKYNGTTLMQQAVMIDAQSIFILAKDLFPKAPAIKKELLGAVKKFKVKNLLESIQF